MTPWGTARRGPDSCRSSVQRHPLAAVVWGRKSCRRCQNAWVSPQSFSRTRTRFLVVSAALPEGREWQNTVSKVGPAMENDRFCLPNAALKRPAGHTLRASHGKLDGLFQPLDATGVPLGGIGTGSITRSSDGRFSRWTLKGGGIANFTMPANGFLLRACPKGAPPQARALQPAPATSEMSSFQYEDEAPEWGGLFPVAWHRHAPLAGIEAVSRSFSPVIPGDLQAATLPASGFPLAANQPERSAGGSLSGLHLQQSERMVRQFFRGAAIAGCGGMLQPSDGPRRWRRACAGPTICCVLAARRIRPMGDCHRGGRGCDAQPDDLFRCHRRRFEILDTLSRYRGRSRPWRRMGFRKRLPGNRTRPSCRRRMCAVHVGTGREQGALCHTRLGLARHFIRSGAEMVAPLHRRLGADGTQRKGSHGARAPQCLDLVDADHRMAQPDAAGSWPRATSGRSGDQ